MKFRSEIHSGDVNKNSGTERKVHSFQPGIDIHITPESVFTSLRNLYSHAPEYALTKRKRIDSLSMRQDGQHGSHGEYRQNQGIPEHYLFLLPP
jgi:hypothetical protein